jgi:glucosamine--fructose-6-phosphate aminotransferase (isomerizing)
LLKTIKKAGAQVFEIDNPMVDSVYSPLTFPLPFYFAAEYLSNKLKIKSLFQVGDKITRVDDTNSKTE